MSSLLPLFKLVEEDFCQRQCYSEADLSAIKSDRKTCVICLEDYEGSDKVILLHCNHLYHENCLKTWRLTCPVDRKAIVNRKLVLLGRSLSVPLNSIMTPYWSFLQGNEALFRQLVEELLKALCLETEPAKKAATLQQFREDSWLFFTDLFNFSPEDTVLTFDGNAFLRLAAALSTLSKLSKILAGFCEEYLKKDLSFDQRFSFHLLQTYLPFVLALLPLDFEKDFHAAFEKLNKVVDRRFFRAHFKAFRERKGFVARLSYIKTLSFAKRRRFAELTRGGGQTSRDIRQKIFIVESADHPVSLLLSVTFLWLSLICFTVAIMNPQYKIQARPL